MKHTLALGLLMTALAMPALAENHDKTEGGAQAHAEHYGMKKMGGKDKHGERAWKEMDANDDGAVSMEESQDFSKKKFEERDANKDGKVTREEWESFYKERMKERREKMHKKDGDAPHHHKQGKPPVDGEKPAETEKTN